MRVGFITQLLWSRYGEFWTKLVSGAGLEPIYAADDAVRRALNDPRLERVPGTAFRLAAAQALALGADADVIFAPELNPGESATRGGGQDAFIAHFPEALATTLVGLPPVIGVPASLSEPGLEGLVVSTLLNLTHDAGLVRRVWERGRGAAKAPRLPDPKWRVRPSEGGTVGVVGQPWLLGDALVRRAAGDVHTVSQHQLDPALLREEGRRLDSRLVGTDTEVLGAARFLGRKGNVERLLMIADETSGTDMWLVTQVERAAHKPLSIVYIQRLGESP
ncbi:MAG: hypothetical protein AVDCRST_MAG86-4189 [uncultured Truepera sp.]|uniref:Uncharacterized protein n=1 Tax=uncultured Truepera sp. TaxID=543023 RepID=A0A6J4VWR2_9DEIN|nr:MAG: hypothetical protein AVDCRST_MAG86-4189 [uncultured Truepera sp.]